MAFTIKRGNIIEVADLHKALEMMVAPDHFKRMKKETELKISAVA